MALRICLVTPFAWSQPHEVNEHVAGVARELRVLGHAVTIIASSNRAADLAAGRAALNGSLNGGELLALGPAVPISRRSRVGVPVGARANVVRALRAGRFDVVHGFEPALPSLSYLALREAESLAAATFFSPERLSYPPGRAQRERLLGRLDVLLATSEDTAARGGGSASRAITALVSEGVDTSLFEPADKQRLIVFEWRPTERPLAARRVAHARRAARLAAHAAANEAADEAAVRSAHAARPRRRAHRARLAEPRDDSGRRRDLRPGDERRLAAQARGRRLWRSRRVTAGHARAAAARRGGDGPARGRRRVPRAAGRRRACVGGGADVHRRRARARGDLRAAARTKAHRQSEAATRSPSTTGSSSTCTRTRARPTTAASRLRCCSSTRRRRDSARSRSPTTTSSPARWKSPSWPETVTSSSSKAKR